MEFLRHIRERKIPTPILDDNLSTKRYCPLDLSIQNNELDKVTISNAEDCQVYIEKVLTREKALVAYGGYLEKRALYGGAMRFCGVEPRNIHLGMDFWCKAGTRVISPMMGTIHSFANNSDFGNYGPTIVLQHKIHGFHFYTLYGHLSLESLKNVYEGKVIRKGDVLGTLGTPEENVGYAPHLHFQVIRDIGDFLGDYPGVC